MISNKLVAEFGGKFSVVSDLGKGAQFTFTIKLEENNHLEEKISKTEGAINYSKFAYNWKPKNKNHPVIFSQTRSLEPNLKKTPSINLSSCTEIEDEEANFILQSIEF
jgi:hypothetical protein